MIGLRPMTPAERAIVTTLRAASRDQKPGADQHKLSARDDDPAPMCEPRQ
ncbi:hypothetical protein [Oceaniglobus trochenteri]|nr:hypothetical protein [Oceaniglobus trochenteri]